MERINRKKEWENFMSMGRLPGNMRPDILESWKRSARHSVADRTSAPVLGEDELENRRLRSRRLGRAAQNAMNRAGHLLIGSSGILLLGDDIGVVIDAVGDPHTLSIAKENQLGPGGNWIEAEIGTNAIGTALHLGAPTLIQDAEHFCEAIQRWNCAATPVIEPGTGRTIGVVDISWPVDVTQPNAVALSSALAMHMESELKHMLAREREALMEQFHFRRMRRGNQPMLILDRSGANVFSTENFDRFCEDDETLRRFRNQLPKLMDDAPEKLADIVADYLGQEDFEIIEDRSEAIGVLISLKKHRPQTRHWAGRALRQIAKAGDLSADLCAQAQRLAETSISILIEGETGSGKTTLAKAIHNESKLSCEPFEIINCPQLTEATLREYITSAQYVSGGVVCLQAPGAVSPEIQKLLLNFVDDIADQGGRVISLSSRPLYDAMCSGTFRSDLYYRIAGARLHIEPLRERTNEIEPLLRQLVQCHAAESGRRELRFTSGAMSALKTYSWPGNLLEMRNLITALDALSPSGLIDEKTLPREFRQPVQRARTETLRDVERLRILDAVENENGNLSRVAKRLGIARSTLYLKLESYGIPRQRKN